MQTAHVYLLFFTMRTDKKTCSPMASYVSVQPRRCVDDQLGGVVPIPLLTTGWR